MSDPSPPSYPSLEHDGFQLIIVEQDSTLPLAAPLPPDDERFTAVPGDIVKLVFQYRDAYPRPDGKLVRAEHMWVQVLDRLDGRLIGELDSDPQHASLLKAGDRITFHPKHIVAFWRD